MNQLAKAMSHPFLSDIAICNMALSNIGASSGIESLTEKSVEARECNTWYEYSRVQALEAFDWSFARKRVTLSSKDIGTVDGIWAYRYAYPADCLTARKLVNVYSDQADALPFEIEINSEGVRTIITNLEDACLVYTFDTPDTTLYSAHFIELLATMVAAKIAFAITRKRSIKETMKEEARLLLLAAPAHDANERVGKKPREAEWIRARTGVSTAPNAKISYRLW